LIRDIVMNDNSIDAIVKDVKEITKECKTWNV
jgi:hypothetical protein